MDFALNLPEKIYNENKNKIKGVLIFIDEFQIIKELNNYKESFLWKIRSYIQNQRNVAYIFSGSMSLQDKLISEIASQNGAFGGRMISINMNPFEKNVLFLFCGGRGDRIKGLLWEGNGFLLLYKRLEDGSFSWPRTPEEAMQLTRKQYEMLMMGLNPIYPKIREVNPQKVF